MSEQISFFNNETAIQIFKKMSKVLQALMLCAILVTLLYQTAHSAPHKSSYAGISIEQAVERFNLTSERERAISFLQACSEIAVNSTAYEGCNFRCMVSKVNYYLSFCFDSVGKISNVEMTGID